MFLMQIFIVGLIICSIILFVKTSELEISIQGLEKKIKHLQEASRNIENNQKADVLLQEQKPANESVENKPEKQVVIKEKEICKKEVKTKKGFDFQKIFLENIFNKIGAIAIIIASIIFIKLISPFFIFTPEMKLTLGFVAGLGTIIGALFLHKKDKYKIFSEVLLGTGFAVLFITDYCAYSLLNLFNSITTLIIGGMLMVVTFFIVDKMKTLSMLIIGLTGAYLTPIFALGELDTVLSYLLYINILSVIYTIRNKNTNLINIINLIITFVTFTCYESAGYDIHCAYPIILWLIYIVYDLFRNKENRKDNILSYINYVVLTVITIILFNDTKDILGWMLFGFAFVYGILSYISRVLKNKLYINYEYSILINIWLFIFFVLDDIFKVIAWAILGFVIFFIAEKLKQIHLKWIGLFYYSTSFAWVFFAKSDNNICFFEEYQPIWNFRTLICIVPALSMLGASKLVKTDNKKIYEFLLFSGISLIYLYFLAEINSIISSLTEDYYGIASFNKLMIYIIIGFTYSLRMKKLAITNNSRFFEVISYMIAIISCSALLFNSYFYPTLLIPILNLRFAAYLFAIFSCIVLLKWTKNDIYKYFAILLGFMLCHVESVGFTKEFDNLLYLISLNWVLYSGITTITGILKNKKYLINTGIVLSILSIIRIFIFDLANVEAIYKLIAFLALGIILMLISYIYTSNKKKG